MPQVITINRKWVLVQFPRTIIILPGVRLEMIQMEETNIILDRYNSCCKTKEKSSNKLNKNSNMIWTIKEN